MIILNLTTHTITTATTKQKINNLSSEFRPTKNQVLATYVLELAHQAADTAMVAKPVFDDDEYFMSMFGQLSITPPSIPFLYTSPVYISE